MAVNRAVHLSEGQGEPTQIYKLATIPLPKPSPGNVVVRMLLRPVNPTDLLVARWGMWAHLNLDEVVVGSEGVGVIREVGEGVTKVKAGERVVPLTFNRYYPAGYGLWRDYVEVPERDVVPVPEDISNEVASQFIINPWTAYGLVNELAIPKGEYLLQTAAASVLGRQIIQLAKYYGIKTINVVRRDEWIKPLKDEGADFVINSKTEDVKAKVKEITGGKGAYGAVDPVIGESTKVVASSVRNGGKVLVYGALSASHVIVDVGDLMRQVSLRFFLVNDFSDDLSKRQETVNAVWTLLSKKIIVPLSGKTYPLEEFKKAIELTELDGRGGKVFLSS